LIIALTVGGLTAILIERSGPQRLILSGLPPDALERYGDRLEPSWMKPGMLTPDQARGRAGAGFTPATVLSIRDLALGRFTEDAGEGYGGREVWIISYGDLDRFGPPFVSGGARADYTCDWAYHYAYIFSFVDAYTGELLDLGTGALFDPSLPPTMTRSGDNDREYCEALARRYGWTTDKSP
jgi:hypothetical protein